MLLTVEELERDSKISRHTWRAWIRQGKVPIVRIGRCVRVELAAYRAFVAEHANEKARQLAAAKGTPVITQIAEKARRMR